MDSKASQRLKEYEKILDALEDKISVVDRDYRYLIVNRAFLKHLNKEENQVIGMLAPDIMGKDIFEDVIKKNLDYCFEGNIVKYEMKCIYPEIGERDLAVTCIPIDENSNVDRVVCVANDITERKKVDAALRESARKYRDIFENINEGIIQTSPDGDILCINPAFAHIMGYNTPEELLFEVKKTFELYANPDDRLLMKRLLGEHEKLQYFEVQLKRRDKSIIWGAINSYIVKDQRGEIRYYEGTLQDITKRKLADEALRESEMRYRLIVNTANEGIWTLNTDTITTYVNKRMADMLGYSVEEMVGQAVEAFMFEEDWADHSKVMQNRKKGISEIYERRFRHKNGQTVWTISSGTPLIANEPAIKGSFAMFTDITKHKEAEEQLRHSQKMEAIGTLAGGIAHDFNNILTGIIGYAQIIKMFHIPEDSPAKKSVENILAAGNRAKALVNQILTISRKVEQKKSNIMLAPIIKEVSKFIRASLPSTIQIRLAINCEKGTVFADPTQIHQVLMNLCTNAAHAMKDNGGILEIKLEELQLKEEKTEGFITLSLGALSQINCI